MIRINPTIQPRSSQPQKPFDLSTIDSAEEAMVMPGADLWVGLVLGPLSGRVTVESAGQQLTYEMRQGRQKVVYTGTLNGNPFKLEGKPANPRGIRVQGETAGGAVDSLRRGGGGGFGLDGEVGEVPFSQMLALDRSGGTSGSLAYLGGKLNGRDLEARATKGPDGTVLVDGKLGDQPLHQTIRTGPTDEWIIQGQIGDHNYTQVIERY